MTRLNLGAGNDVRSGYENLDIRDIPGVIQRDVSDRESMMVFAGAEEILAYDILEHFDRQTSHDCLKLWADLLMVGGVLKIRCPDLRHAANVHQDDVNLEQLIYGGQDYSENFHQCGYTIKLMRQYLSFCGLTVILEKLTPAGNMEISAVKE